MNVMKSQKATIEQKLNNLIGKKNAMKPDDVQRLQSEMETEIKCYSKTINDLRVQINQL